MLSSPDAYDHQHRDLQLSEGRGIETPFWGEIYNRERVVVSTYILFSLPYQIPC